MCLRCVPNRYRWIKDGKDFILSDHVDTVVQKTEAGTLTFLKPKVEDEGEYLCFAENEDGIARSNSVTLKKAFLENFKNDSARTIEADEGESLKLECKAPKGYPKPSIFWMIQTVHGAIKSVDNPRVTLDPAGNLWFSSVSRDDASKDSHYVCSAASTVVNEYKLGNRIMLKVIPRISKSLNGSPPTPQYVSSPDVLVLRGKKVELFCIYDGTPNPKVVWSKDGKPIEFDERVVLENYGKSLTVKNSDAEDEGKYECEVSSEIGDTKTSSFNLKVELPPHITVEPHSHNVTMNDEVLEIECKVAGTPEPKIQWFFNGKPLEKEENSRREISDHKIVVRNVEKSDKGNYACYATNVHGYVSRDIYVNVQD